jgi:hypothetical protein
MSNQASPIPSPDTQAALDCLRQAVAKALERKRRLGQYAVFWSGDRPVAVGEDAPAHLRPSQEAS